MLGGYQVLLASVLLAQTSVLLLLCAAMSTSGQTVSALVAVIQYELPSAMHEMRLELERTRREVERARRDVERARMGAEDILSASISPHLVRAVRHTLISAIVTIDVQNAFADPVHRDYHQELGRACSSMSEAILQLDDAIMDVDV